MAEIDYLKLTTYFGERDRAGGVLLADALLDLYGERRLAMSVLLRGALGFGAAQHLHSDRLLSLSEDLPVISVAVDRRDRIEAVLGEVLELQRRGLVTLERARPAESAGDDAGPVKLTFYLGRHERVGRRPAFVALCARLHTLGVDGATVLLGVDGTRGGQRRRAAFFSRNTDVPLMVIAAGDADRMSQALSAATDMLAEPLITRERIRVCKRDGQRLESPPVLPGTDEHGLALWQKLTIYTSEAAHNGGRHPLHVEIVRRLRASGLAGATCVRGIWGYHGARAPHGDRLLALARHVPVMTVVIDTPQRIADAFAVIDPLTARHGLVTSEIVPARRAPAVGRGGLRLAAPRP